MLHSRDDLRDQGQVAKLAWGAKDWAREASSGIGELGSRLGEGARPQGQLQSGTRGRLKPPCFDRGLSGGMSMFIEEQGLILDAGKLSAIQYKALVSGITSVHTESLQT